MSNQFETIIDQAIAAHCSDLYCLPRPDHYLMQGRRDGQMIFSRKTDSAFAKRLLAFLKYHDHLAVSEHRRPQAGAMSWHGANGQVTDLRLSVVGNYQGQESLVVRFIYGMEMSHYQLLVPEQWEQITTAIKQRGLFLFAGPMGSGKTTTMYRLGRSLVSSAVVMTIEDPVEIFEPTFLQLQVNELAGMGYAELLRVGLRHRPDIFIIGEIRDQQTAMMAVRAALSGHLVLATVHARTACGVIDRLLQLGIDQHYLTATISGVAYQRLLPTMPGHAAVLFDLLVGRGLNEAISGNRKVGMSDEWERHLQGALTGGTIGKQTAENYRAG